MTGRRAQPNVGGMLGRRSLGAAVSLGLALGVGGCGRASVTGSEEAQRSPAARVADGAASASVVPPGSSASGPSPSSTTTVGASSATSSSAHAGATPVAPTLGTFQPRLKLPEAEDPELRCAPRIAAMAGLSNGDAFIVGLCGLRARITPSEVVDARAQPQRRRGGGAGADACWATAWYDGVFTRSPTEVYAHGFSSCGTDPNSVWSHPIERFDGQRWTPYPLPPFELRPDVLIAGAHGPVYGAQLGCTACEEPPFCSIMELGTKGLRKLRECRSPRPGGSGTAERFLSTVVDEHSVLWVSGYRNHWPDGGEPQHFLLRYENGTWSEHRFEDSGTFELDSAGQLWLFGSSAVWRRIEGQWQRFEPLAQYMPTPEAAESGRPAGDVGWLLLPEARPAAPEAIAVRSEREIWWFGRGREVYHFDGRGVRSVPVADLAPDDVHFPFAELELAGSRVYLRSTSRVWELIPPFAVKPREVLLASNTGASVTRSP